MEPKRPLNEVVLDEIAQQNQPVFLPILIDIRHNKITWSDAGLPGMPRQEDGHLRLVNNIQGLMYKGDDREAHYYAPCSFAFKPGKEDGKSKSNATIGISAVDYRIIEVIREVDENLTCQIVAMFSKIVNSEGRTAYTFSKLYGKLFEMTSVSWDGVTASWQLDPDSTLDMNAPRDKGSYFRFPAIMKDSK